MKAPKLLPAEEVRRLSELSPWRSAWAMGRTLGVTAAIVAIAARWPSPWVIAACALAMPTQQHAFAILAHEAAHYRLFESRRLNDLAGRVFSYPLFVSVVTYRAIHNVHHNHLYSAVDPDLALMAGYPRGKAYLLKKLAKDLLGVTVIKNYLYFTGKPQGSSDTMDERPDGTRDAARRDRRAMLAVHALLLPVWIATGWWRLYLVLWILPAFTLFQAILRLRAIAEHGAVPDTTQVTKAARTIVPGPISRVLLFPLHVSYHVEHHLYPSVPCYRLPDCHRALVARGALDDAEVTTFRAMLRKVFADRGAQPAPRGA